jgi:long-chain acyl-CoA synthetase
LGFEREPEVVVLAELLLPIVERKPDEIAISSEFGDFTWTQTNERCNRLIHGLRSLGLEVGDQVALLAGNRHEYGEVNSACFNAGWVLVPVNWHLTAPEIAYILADSEARAFIVDPDFAETAVKASSDVSGLKAKVILSGGSAEGFVDYEEVLAGSSPNEPAGQVAGGNMFYTSGTTGNPKGVRSTALAPGGPLAVLKATVEGLAALLNIHGDSKMFVNSPLYHAGPYTWTMVAAAIGSPILMRQKFDPVETLALIDSEKVEQAYFVPTHFVRFLKLDDAEKAKFKGDSLKAVFHTGAPCPPDVKRAMIDWWGPVFVDYYGASEGAGSGTIITSEEWLKKPGSVGKPIATCEVWILDDKGKRLGPKEVGQIYFKNLLGTDFEYHNAPEKTQTAHLEPGVYTYGDVGYLDDDGYLFLSDRKIDMIVSGGVNIYPAEIESVLISHPAVADVAAFGIPNDEFGEEVKVAVQLAPGKDASKDLESEIKSFASERMAKYKVPRTIDFHEEFPRTATGKLLKRLLRDPYWEGKDRAI